MHALPGRRRPPSYTVDAWEISQPGGGEELESPYLQGGDLAVRDWAHDALALALPAQILCVPDCAGLCPECGVRLDDAGPDHATSRARSALGQAVGDPVRRMSRSARGLVRTHPIARGTLSSLFLLKPLKASRLSGR